MSAVNLAVSQEIGSLHATMGHIRHRVLVYLGQSVEFRDVFARWIQLFVLNVSNSTSTLEWLENISKLVLFARRVGLEFLVRFIIAKTCFSLGFVVLGVHYYSGSAVIGRDDHYVLTVL